MWAPLYVRLTRSGSPAPSEELVSAGVLGINLSSLASSSAIVVMLELDEAFDVELTRCSSTQLMVRTFLMDKEAICGVLSPNRNRAEKICQ